MRRVAHHAVRTAQCAVVVAVAVAAWIAWPLPKALTAPVAVPSVTLTDRNGLVLRATRAGDGSRAQWMPITEIDPDIITAFVAMEDRRFYDHGAIDWRAVARAARDNARAGHVVSGASTITMQTARLLRPVARSWMGKLAQALWALRLEAHLGKQQILEQYLNRVHLGQGAVGVAAGAALYFGASAREVSVAQAAMLAGLAHAPSRDNPLVSARRARARRALVLSRLRSAGYATSREIARAAEEPLLAPDHSTLFLAPHFTTHVLERADADHERADGAWRTSLDLALQTELEEEVRRVVADLRDRGARQAAAVVLQNGSGEVLAWVGSPDFWSDSAGQTDMVISPRQPGSALKPFLYGLAFDQGLTPASVLADVVRAYQTSTGPYRPRNYDHRYHGPVRAREALASSYNVPAVALAERVGASSLLTTLHLAGFESLGHSADYYGLGLALGNGDVSLLELANGYRALVNGGVWTPYSWWATPQNVRRGSWDVEAWSVGHRARERRVMSARSAALVLDILSDPAARVPGFGLETPLDFPFPVAAKTGTSRHFTDNWAVAATGAFTVAVWVGNFSGRPMDGVSGVSGAGPLLHRAVMLTAARYAPGELPTPERAGAAQVEVCRLSGLRPSRDCPRITEWFAPGTEPRRLCDWHRAGRVALPAEYAEWAEQSGSEGGGGGEVPVTTTAARHDNDTLSAGARFRITSPLDGDRYQVPPGVDARYATIALRVVGAREPSGVRWFVDGKAATEPRFRLKRGEHVIRAVGMPGEMDEARITVE